MTEHERIVIAEWQAAGEKDWVDSLKQYAADIDLLSPVERAWASELMFGRPGPRPVGLLSDAWTLNTL